MFVIKCFLFVVFLIGAVVCLLFYFISSDKDNFLFISFWGCFQSALILFNNIKSDSLFDLQMDRIKKEFNRIVIYIKNKE